MSKWVLEPIRDKELLEHNICWVLKSEQIGLLATEDYFARKASHLLNSAESDRAELEYCLKLLRRCESHAHGLPETLSDDIRAVLAKEPKTLTDDYIPPLEMNSTSAPRPDLRAALQEYLEAHKQLLATSEALIASLK